MLLREGDRGAAEARLYARGWSTREVARAILPDSKRVQTFVRSNDTDGARAYLRGFGIEGGKADRELQAAANAILKQDRPWTWRRRELRVWSVVVVAGLIGALFAPYLEAFVERWS